MSAPGKEPDRRTLVIDTARSAESMPCPAAGFLSQQLADLTPR
jgi:hypothetical protein